MTNTRGWIPRASLALGVAAIAALYTAPASAAKTYWIDETTDFSGNGCENGDVNNVTSSLQTSLTAAGWTGSRWDNANAWPQDFFEQCSSIYGVGGIDGSCGDANALTVYAGHGGPHYVQFGYVNNGYCGVDFTNNARLGAMSGSLAVFGMWLACSVIQGSEMSTAMYQRMRQQAGWQNSIGIGDNEPRDFFDATVAKTNANAWLDQMSSGGRDAIIVTFSNTSVANAQAYHRLSKLKGNLYNTPMGGGPACGGAQTLYYYYYEHRIG